MKIAMNALLMKLGLDGTECGGFLLSVRSGRGTVAKVSAESLILLS